MTRRTFPAMGTTVELLLDADSSPAAQEALDRAQAVFTRIEGACSRFDGASELSAVNRSGGGRVSALLADIVGLALEARERTGGLFDPTVHDAVVAAGYDRTFTALEPRPVADPVPAAGAVELDGDVVRLGPGARLDLGGIAKGYAADHACRALAASGPCLVDAGGDVAVRGTWHVAVEGGPTLELTDAAVATSGRDRRTWRRGDGTAHHLIDPLTGAPAVTPVLRATVVATTAAEAEVLAKEAFLRGTTDAPGVLVRDDGTTTLTGGLA